MPIQQVAASLLNEIYDGTLHGHAQVINLMQKAKAKGVDKRLFIAALSYLETKGFVKLPGELQNSVILTAKGVEAIENRDQPGTPLYDMRQYFSIQAQSITAGTLQQGSGNIALTLTYQEVFQKLEQEIEKSNMLEPVKKKLLGKLRDFAIDLGAEALKKVILKG